MDAADFYTGIVADLYAPLKSVTFPCRPYADFIDRFGQPALELGCGDGEPILDLVESGYRVDGVDSSADMLARLRDAADARGLDVTVYRQRMEDLELGITYRSIYLAGPTITLLPDDRTVLSSLRRIRTHLDPEGAALVPLWIPAPATPAVVGTTREHADPDGSVLRVGTLSVDRDDDARVQQTALRYEMSGPGGSVSETRLWTVHWQTPETFAGLVERAGLAIVETSGEGGSPGDEWSVILRAMDERRSG